MVDVTSLLKIGERIDVEMNGKAFKSKLQDVLAPNIVCISHPLDQNAPLFIPREQMVDLVFFRYNGMFSVISKYLGREIRENHLKIVSFEVLGEPTKHQRRDGYRLDIKRAITMRQVTVDKNEPKDSFKTITEDISEAGVLVRSEKAYSIGTMFECMLTLERSIGEMVSFCAVVRRCIWPKGRTEPYLLGLQMVDPPVKLKKKISNFIMNEQVKIRQRS